MKRNKTRCLIATGCSFTQVPTADVSWPVHLRDYLNHIECTYFLGQGAAGNGIISRRTIYHTLKAMKSYDTNDILVGIMWSGADRHDFYQANPNITFNNFEGGEFYCNPVRVAEDYNYYILNNHWDDEATLMYYKHFYDSINSYIITLEHILRTQMFLQKYNIPYFMTEYSFDVLPRDPNIINNPDIKYLYDMIDRSYWLPIDNMWQYATDSGIPFARPPDPHPSTEHHKKFTEEVILSYLQKKNYF
jgi:hypothetical protein